MKKNAIYFLIGILFLSLSSFVFHKFYMGIFQVNYVAEKNGPDYVKDICG